MRVTIGVADLGRLGFPKRGIARVFPFVIARFFPPCHCEERSDEAISLSNNPLP